MLRRRETHIFQVYSEDRLNLKDLVRQLRSSLSQCFIMALTQRNGIQISIKKGKKRFKAFKIGHLNYLWIWDLPS